tara:strand:- start:229 stop:1161 length:933 start_codon:yes stop_codon:yes gene_type:complete
MSKKRRNNKRNTKRNARRSNRQRRRKSNRKTNNNISLGRLAKEWSNSDLANLMKDDVIDWLNKHVAKNDYNETLKREVDKVKDYSDRDIVLLAGWIQTMCDWEKIKDLGIEGVRKKGIDVDDKEKRLLRHMPIMMSLRLLIHSAYVMHTAYTSNHYLNTQDYSKTTFCLDNGMLSIECDDTFHQSMTDITEAIFNIYGHYASFGQCIIMVLLWIRKDLINNKSIGKDEWKGITYRDLLRYITSIEGVVDNGKTLDIEKACEIHKEEREREYNELVNKGFLDTPMELKDIDDEADDHLNTSFYDWLDDKVA